MRQILIAETVDDNYAAVAPEKNDFDLVFGKTNET
jgi:hypothetical protein